MPASKFDKDVCTLQNVLIPEAERVAGHPLLPTERMTITKLIRESLADPDPRKVAELKRWITPKTPAVGPGFTETAAFRALAEQAPTSPAPAPKNPLVEERVKAELLQRCRGARRMLGRGLTAEEQADLEQTIRERFGASFAKLAETTRVMRPSALAEAQFAAHAGGSSPFFRIPTSAAQITESAAIVPGHSAKELGAEMNRIARMSLVEAREAREAVMLAYARRTPFGAERLDQS